MQFSVLFEDEHIVAIDKPSGLVVHPFDFSNEETVLDMLQKERPEIFTINNSFTLQDGRTINLGGIVHKLDRDTSGVLVIAKNQLIFDELREQFSSQKVTKIYLALVEGIVANNSFRINAPLGRNKKEYKQSVNPMNLRGELREAITDVNVLERREHTTLLKCMPKTGRTHQLRAHLSSIGNPIVGDKAYGSTTESDRIMLHAQSIGFTLFGKKYKIESDKSLLVGRY